MSLLWKEGPVEGVEERGGNPDGLESFSWFL
jgi:hypothetical protein